MRQRGFTLIELILAITLLSMILAMAYQGLTAGIRSVERGEALVDRSNRLRVVQGFLRNQLSRILPLAMRHDEGDETVIVIFEGDDENMRFVAPMPGYLGHGGPHEQFLSFARSDGEGLDLLFGHRLLRSEDENDPLTDPDRPPTVLLSQIKSGEFSYLTLDDEGNPTEWIDEWEDPSVSPVLVRIEIEMLEESRIIFPTLEVAPLIDGSAIRRGTPNIMRPNASTGRRREASRE